MKKRNQMVELLRILLIAGICFLHSIQFGGFRNDWIAESFKVCVVCFVFISGFYGVTFSFSKIVHLYLTGIYCSAVSVLMQSAIFGCGCFGFLKTLVLTFYGHWFLHAYVIMLIFASCFNGLFAEIEHGDYDRKRNAFSIVLSFLLVVFIWAFLPNLIVVGRYFQGPIGFHVFSGMSLLGIYVAARCWKVFNLSARFRPAYSVCLIVLLIPIINTLRLGAYVSPFLFLLAASIFMIVSRMREHRVVASIVRLLAPSVFAIYLIHSTRFGFNVIQACEHWLVGYGMPIFVAWVVTAVVLFIGAFILDIPRRVLLERFWKSAYFDSLYSRLVGIIYSRVSQEKCG